MLLDGISELKDISALFTSRCDHFDEATFFGSLFSYPKLEVKLETFNIMVNDLISEATIDFFETTPTYTAMRMLYKSAPELRQEWKKLIRRLLAVEPDLHDSWWGCTMLDNILESAECPFDSQEMCEEWLMILEDVGIDIAEYLRTELVYQYQYGSVPILLQPWGLLRSETKDCLRYRCHIFSETKPRVSWDWYINPQGHAFEVLREFGNLGPIDHHPGKDFYFSHKTCNWPYFYPRWESCRNAPRSYITEDMKPSLLKLFENRFERRCIKKGNKLKRAQGIRNGPKVPGAWID
jgi:hypothetical protein